MAENLRILLTRRWPEAVEDYLAERYDVDVNERDEPMAADALQAAFDSYDVVCPTVSDAISAEIIGATKRRTALIANYGVGVDHIDLRQCETVGIPVTNTPGVLTDATADLAMTLMLMAARRAGEGERELRAGKWTGWRPTHLPGRSVTGKTLGLVGFGRIGQALAKRAHFGFGMQIVYYSRSAAEAEITDAIKARRADSLSDLLGVSDFVSLHVPGGAETNGMIGAEELSVMKEGAILVNTARGGVVDHAALTARLTSGALRAAGLDVYPNEPHIPEGLARLENVVLLPHLGSATEETRVAMGLRVAKNIDSWAGGEPLPDRVV